MGRELRWAAAIFLLVIPSARGAAEPPIEVPKVSIESFSLIEVYCGTVSKTPPTPETLAEIQRRLPEFRVAWEKAGPELMRATVAVTGKQYRFSETVATLHGCPDLSSMSYPLLIAVARYTDAAGGGAISGLVRRAIDTGQSLPRSPPLPLSDFVYTLWHEMAHRHVSDALSAYSDRQSPLMRKYAAESRATRAHLHLLAIEQLALRNLGREAEYHARAADTRAKAVANYIRAYEIVEAESAEAFVAEFKSAGVKDR